jgi:methyl-accepting chemotaxis protein
MVVPLDNKFTRSMTGVNNPAIDKNSRIQQSVMQMVSAETNKAIKAINETNAPMQNMSAEISNSMRKVMSAHNDTMNQLAYKLSEMIDAMNTSNDVTKKILKKASA